MDEYKEDTDEIKDKIAAISLGLSTHRDNLTDVLMEVDDEKQDLVLSQFDETYNNWNSMVETQRIMFNQMDQETLLNSIEIGGLPEEYAKDIKGVAFILSKLLHISIHESYITGFERVETISPPDQASGSGNPRPLVVSLIDQNIKKRILTVAESVVLNVIGSDRPMYIMEHLTLENNQLLKKARREALQQHINEVWVKDGKIFVRRNDMSIIHEIKSDADIKRMAYY